jgi:adenosylcobinamide kinase/adenosylcobinamide-phosphate guanylyltransferase
MQGNNRELILIIGGARAGKSAFATALACELESANSSPDSARDLGNLGPDSAKVAFIATAEALDDEMAARIERHRTERSANWLTVEEPLDLALALRKASSAQVVIVDCFTLFVSNWLLSIDALETCEARIESATGAFLAVFRDASQTVICVSNEVGLGLVPDTAVGRVYRDCLGRVNQNLANAADRVYWLVAGIPVQIKPKMG